MANGEVPIVKITEAEPIKIGKGKSREINFEIVKMVPRPQAFVDALAKLKAAGATTKKDRPPAAVALQTTMLVTSAKA